MVREERRGRDRGEGPDEGIRTGNMPRTRMRHAPLRILMCAHQRESSSSAKEYLCAEVSGNSQTPCSTLIVSVPEELIASLQRGLIDCFASFIQIRLGSNATLSFISSCENFRFTRPLLPAPLPLVASSPLPLPLNAFVPASHSCHPSFPPSDSPSYCIYRGAG